MQLSRNGVGDAQLARSLAKAFRHFWAGDFESCVHLVTPKIEAAARSLLRELDEGVYRVQNGAALGGCPGLGVLLGELNKLALDETWAYFLGWLLHDRYGMNLRNEVAHGFLAETSPIYAALTLRAAALLVTVAGPNREDRGGSSIATPTLERGREDVLALLGTPNRPSGPKRGSRLLDATCAVLGRLWWSAERARAIRQARKGEAPPANGRG